MSTLSGASSDSTSKKMTPCSFFAANKCRNSKTCNFYHAPREELAINPLPCKFFLRGTCTAGRGCKFLHATAKQASAMRVSATTGDKTLAPGSYGIPCKYFKYGDCSNGNNCLYLHVEKAGKHKDKAEATKKRTFTRDNMSSKEYEVKSPVTDVLGIRQDIHNGEEEEAKELKDFISEKEELYYYGAPGDFEEVVVEVRPVTKQTYVEVAKITLKDEPMLFDKELPAPRKICTFFLQGQCQYGKSCFYSHTLPERVESEEEMLAMGEEIRLSQDLECGICYDNILKKTCVRNWRSTEDQPKQTVRQCPLCRVETKFIIPSSRMVTAPDRKNDLINGYRKNLNGIPCRHFDEGRGTCPFGTSCFYAHRYPDGTLASRQVRIAVDADGQYNVLQQVRLDQFVTQSGINE